MKFDTCDSLDLVHYCSISKFPAQRFGSRLLPAVSSREGSFGSQAISGDRNENVPMNRTHLAILIFCALSLIPLSGPAQTWQPSPGHTQTPIWPGTPPDAQPSPKPESVVTTSHLVAGRHYQAILNVSLPTMTIYSPTGKDTGAAVVVLPGGGFNSLAIDLEGTEACDWLAVRGITCVLWIRCASRSFTTLRWRKLVSRRNCTSSQKAGMRLGRGRQAILSRTGRRWSRPGSRQSA